MELYRKKISIAGKVKPLPQDRFLRNERYRYEIYLQKSIEQQNVTPQSNLINISNINESIPNFRTSMQDLFSNDESRRKAIKYVINAQRRRSPSPSGEVINFQRSVSPKNNKQKTKINFDISETSPNFYKNRLVKSKEPFSNLTTRNKNLYNGNPNLSNYQISYTNSNVNSVRRGQNKDSSRFNTSISKDKNLYHFVKKGVYL